MPDDDCQSCNRNVANNLKVLLPTVKVQDLLPKFICTWQTQPQTWSQPVPMMGAMLPVSILLPIAIASTPNATQASLINNPLTAMAGTSPILATITGTGAARPPLGWPLYLHTSWGRFRQSSSLTRLNSCEKRGCPRQRNRPATAGVEGWQQPGSTHNKLYPRGSCKVVLTPKTFLPPSCIFWKRSRAEN